MRTSTRAITATAAILVALGTAYNFGTEQSRTCTVTDTNPHTGKDGQPDGYRVHTEECGELGVGALLRGPSDIKGLYQSIEPGHTYTFTTIGLWHPTIIDAQPAQGTP